MFQGNAPIFFLILFIYLIIYGHIWTLILI
jgi:hypothetical protein